MYQALRLPSLDSAFELSGAQVTNDSEAIGTAPYDALHKAIGAETTSSRRKAPLVVIPKIKAGISQLGGGVFEQAFNLFKEAIEVQPNKVAHQLLNCLDKKTTLLGDQWARETDWGKSTSNVLL